VFDYRELLVVLAWICLGSLVVAGLLQSVVYLSKERKLKGAESWRNGAQFLLITAAVFSFIVTFIVLGIHDFL